MLIDKLTADPRVAFALAFAMVLLTTIAWTRKRALPKARLYMSDVARVECLATDRLMHKIVFPAREVSDVSGGRKTLVLMVPGNPGVPGFYEPFMRHLHELGGRSMEIVGLSHTGHSLPWINQNQAFDLETQVVDKLAYVEKRLRKDPSLQLVLIGHSIGCHVSLRLLEHFPDQVEKLVLIQPAVMHIAQTPRGKQMMPMFVNFRWISYLAWPIGKLPTAIKRVLVQLFVRHPAFHKAALSMCDHNVLRNCLKMALHEMQELKDIDHGLVSKHQHKIMFVFSEYDGWCPPEQVEHLQKNYTKAKHVTVGLPHAFMLAEDGSTVMAQHAYSWLRDSALAG